MYVYDWYGFGLMLRWRFRPSIWAGIEPRLLASTVRLTGIPDLGVGSWWSQQACALILQHGEGHVYIPIVRPNGTTAQCRKLMYAYSFLFSCASAAVDVCYRFQTARHSRSFLKVSSTAIQLGVTTSTQAYPELWMELGPDRKLQRLTGMLNARESQDR